MSRIKLLLIMITLLFLQGCQEKKNEELINTVTEYQCETADVMFTLNGLWNVNTEKINENEIEIELSAQHREAGNEILVFHHQLEEEKGGNLLRLDDYVIEIIRKLEESEVYNYTLSEISDTILYKNRYKTFEAVTDSPDSRHYFYIREKDDKIISIVITIYGQDSVGDIIKLGKKISE